jgi:uncharacterized protein with HEPN domain
MNDRAAMLIELVQGAATAIQAQIEESLPELPWNDLLRASVRQTLEARIGPHVAKVLESLVKAAMER